MRKFTCLILILLLGWQFAFAQKLLVKGTVTGADDGLAVPGVSIIEKGTTNGTITDLDGKYQISVAENAILSFSFVGMKTQEVEVKGQTTINVAMKSEAIGLEELVVVGYGTQKKANLTGAVSTVNVEKTIESRPISDVGRALQGAVAGLSVTTTTGEIGTSPKIKIRGTVGSSNGSSNPLILVDNVMISDITLVNPDDIESISVLKDAASTAIYGARAAFGVILITTKSKKSRIRPVFRIATILHGGLLLIFRNNCPDGNRER